MSSPPSPPAPPSPSGPRVITVAIASLSSVAAAIVVSRIWGPGTLIGAAATPIIVTLVSELLRKPAAVVVAPVVRTAAPGPGPTGTQVHQHAAPRPRAMTDAGVDPAAAPDLLEAPTTVLPPAKRLRRGPVAVAVVTGLVAFVIGAFVLTGGELAFGGSANGSGSTSTLFSADHGSSGSKKPHGTTTHKDRTTSTPTTTTVTKTTKTPAPTTTEPDTGATGDATPVVPPADGGATGATGATGTTGP